MPFSMPLLLFLSGNSPAALDAGRLLLLLLLLADIVEAPLVARSDGPAPVDVRACVPARLTPTAHSLFPSARPRPSELERMRRRLQTNEREMSGRLGERTSERFRPVGEWRACEQKGSRG